MRKQGVKKNYYARWRKRAAQRSADYLIARYQDCISPKGALLTQPACVSSIRRQDNRILLVLSLFWMLDEIYYIET